MTNGSVIDHCPKLTADTAYKIPKNDTDTVYKLYFSS